MGTKAWIWHSYGGLVDSRRDKQVCWHDVNPLKKLERIKLKLIFCFELNKGDVSRKVYYAVDKSSTACFGRYFMLIIKTKFYSVCNCEEVSFSKFLLRIVYIWTSPAASYALNEVALPTETPLTTRCGQRGPWLPTSPIITTSESGAPRALSLCQNLQSDC